MTDEPMPVFSSKDKNAGSRGAMLCGAVAILVGLWLPLFTTIEWRENPSGHSMWDLHQLGAPGFVLYTLGAILLLAGSLIPPHLRAISIRAWLMGIAVAEGLGVLLSVAVGFSMVLTGYGSTDTHQIRYSEIDFQPGLLVLLAGLAAALVGSWQQWSADAHYIHPFETPSADEGDAAPTG